MMQTTNDTEKKYQLIFSQKLAGSLMQSGFVLLEMRSDLRNPRRNVFIFRNSPELQKVMGQYMKA